MLHVKGSLTLLSSLQHGGDETLGTVKLFRTKGFITAGGQKLQLPMMSGNGIRGMWRRHAAAAFLDALGAKLSTAAFYYLFSGGSLTKGDGAKSLDLTEERRFREAIPIASVFGGAGMGKIQAGKLYVDEGIPICLETAERLRPAYGEWVDTAPTVGLSIRELTEIHGYTRSDDLKNENQHVWLNEESAHQAAVRILKGQTGEDALEAGAAQQMRYESVELVAGTLLAHSWGEVHPMTDIEKAALLVGIARWMGRPVLGGRSAVGHGRVLPRYSDVGMTYEDADNLLGWHIEANRERILETLKGIG